MRKHLLVVAAAGYCLFGTYSCKKANSTIDNDQVIETPYSLYFGDTTGVLYNTNDGINIQKVPFPADGNPFRAIVTADQNILFSKENRNYPTLNNTHLYFSSDNGAYFKESYDSIKSIPSQAVNGMHFDLYQNSIVNIPKWHRVYVISNNTSPDDFLGIVYSFQDGNWGSWTVENYYNTNRVALPVPLTLTSLTLTKSSILYGIDALTQRTFYRADTLNTTMFNETTSNIYAPGTPLPNTGFFSLGHINEELVAIDNTGINGAYFSDDSGYHWQQFSGLPLNIPLFCVAAPFEQFCFIGTGGAGLYIMNINTHSFQPCNNGMKPGLVVRGVVGKQNIYKNGNVQNVIFAATNGGLYKSVDNGENWILAYAGNFTAIY